MPGHPGHPGQRKWQHRVGCGMQTSITERVRFKMSKNTYRRVTEKDISAAMAEVAAEDLNDLFEKLTHCGDTRERELVCTPCGGNYGSVAYWVIAVNGSPPRGTILFGGHFDSPADIFFFDQSRGRHLGQQQ